MKYVFILLMLFVTSPLYSQSIDLGSKNGSSFSYESGSVIRRGDFVLFWGNVKSTTTKDYLRTLFMAQCTSHSFIFLVHEGIENGKDVIGPADPTVLYQPEPKQFLDQAITKACLSTDYILLQPGKSAKNE